MKKKTLYWLAGLLEGEGSFMKGPPSNPNIPRISLQMTDKDVVKKVATLFGVTYFKRSRSAKFKENGWRRVYHVLLCGKPAIRMMQKLEPLMGKRRRRQIKEAVASHRVLRRNLSIVEVQEVRRAKGKTSAKLLADRYSVTEYHIQRVWDGKAYRNYA